MSSIRLGMRLELGERKGATMPIRRRLSEAWFDKPPQFLMAAANDPHLQVEIRDEAVTVYYRGRALLRDVSQSPEGFSGLTHGRYIPVAASQKYVTQLDAGQGFAFRTEVLPVPLGDFQPDVIREYKRLIAADGAPECKIIGQIVEDPRNCIVDQEIKFQEAGEPVSDKIDLCHFNTRLNALAMVEVKGVDDRRLLLGVGDVPEVVEQLERYCFRIGSQHANIVEAMNEIVAIKRAPWFRQSVGGSTRLPFRATSQAGAGNR